MSVSSERKQMGETLAAYHLMRPAVAARFVEVSEDDLWKATERGEVPSVLVGSQTRYDPMSLVEWYMGVELDPEMDDFPPGFAETFVRLYRALPSSWVKPKKVPRGKVYLIETTEGPHRVKIGFSTKPKQRLRSLQTASPVKLRIRATGFGTTNDEQELHERFADHRLHGEWFEPDVIEAVEAYLQGGE